ncbi:MAG TPA: ABC transporter substrate-binding protein [Chloroflexota bacterium]|nr:ABC transporter substrate-binding protein [Chloroflexota bacterium]
MSSRLIVIAPRQARRAAAAALALALSACAGNAAPPPGPPSAPAASPTASAAPATAPPSRARMRIPFTAISIVNAPLWVAQEGGYLAEEGIDADVEYIATSTTLTQAMLSGEVAIADSGQEALVAADLGGADLVAIAVGTDRFIFRIFGAGPVRSLADLRGRRVGITRYGSTTDTVTRLMLKRAGLDPDRDVSILQVGGVPEILAALQSGSIDAGALSPPTMFRAAADYNLLVDTTQIDVYFHQAMLITPRAYLAENEPLVRRVIRGYLRGVARFKQDEAFAASVTGKYTQTDDADILEQSWAAEDRVLPRVPLTRPDAIQVSLDEAAGQYPDARNRSPSDFYDNRLVQEQDANGFIASLYH